MSRKWIIASISLITFVCLISCLPTDNTRSWIGTYYYDICCNKGTSSEYWNLVLNDSAGHISGMLYFGTDSEKAAVSCAVTGDTAHIDIVLRQPIELPAFKAIAMDEVLFTLKRKDDGSIETIWKSIHPQCPEAKSNNGICFTNSQPGTINDPCAGENPETQQSTNQADDEGNTDIKIDTAELRIAFNDGITQATLAPEAIRIMHGGVKVQISKSFDEALLLSNLADKNIETSDCFQTSEGGTISLHVKQPLPSFIITGSSKSADVEHKSRIKSIDIIWEFEKVGHIELTNTAGIQYLKQLDELRTNGPENGLEIELTAYPTSKEVCISELF